MDCQVWVLVGAAAALTVSVALQDTVGSPLRQLRIQADDAPLAPFSLYDTAVVPPSVPSGLYDTPVAQPVPSENRPASPGLLQTPSETVYSPSDTFQDPSDAFQAPAAPSDLYKTPAAPSDSSKTPAAPSDSFKTPAAPPDAFEALPAPSDALRTPSEQDETPSVSDPRLQEAAQNLQPDVARPMEGMPYGFQFGVDDPASGNSYSHVESSDGRTTQGEYRVLLPDGRTQVVTFFDNGQGFTARVTYQQ